MKQFDEERSGFRGHHCSSAGRGPGKFGYQDNLCADVCFSACQPSTHCGEGTTGFHSIWILALVRSVGRWKVFIPSGVNEVRDFRILWHLQHQSDFIKLKIQSNTDPAEASEGFCGCYRRRVNIWRGCVTLGMKFLIFSKVIGKVVEIWSRTFGLFSLCSHPELNFIPPNADTHFSLPILRLTSGFLRDPEGRVSRQASSPSGTGSL